MRKEKENNIIEIKKDVRIGDIILEKGDKIQVKEVELKEALKIRTFNGDTYNVVYSGTGSENRARLSINLDIPVQLTSIIQKDDDTGEVLDDVKELDIVYDRQKLEQNIQDQVEKQLTSILKEKFIAEGSSISIEFPHRIANFVSA